MKKILFLAGAVVLLAAACNRTASQNAAQNQVDATVSDLNMSVNSEGNVSSQSDTDLHQSDQAVVNDSEGVTNANY